MNKEKRPINPERMDYIEKGAGRPRKRLRLHCFCCRKFRGRHFRGCGRFLRRRFRGGRRWQG